eukprot:1137578-Pelagomonas_calceolata.AAC.2
MPSYLQKSKQRYKSPADPPYYTVPQSGTGASTGDQRAWSFKNNGAVLVLPTTTQIRTTTNTTPGIHAWGV